MLPRVLALAISVAIVALPACRHGGGKVLEIAYVSGVQVTLRDRVAAV